MCDIFILTFEQVGIAPMTKLSQNITYQKHHRTNEIQITITIIKYVIWQTLIVMQLVVRSPWNLEECLCSSLDIGGLLDAKQNSKIDEVWKRTGNQCVSNGDINSQEHLRKDFSYRVNVTTKYWFYWNQYVIDTEISGWQSHNTYIKIKWLNLHHTLQAPQVYANKNMLG